MALSHRTRQVLPAVCGGGRAREEPGAHRRKASAKRRGSTPRERGQGGVRAVLLRRDNVLEAVWKQSLYKRRPYVMCWARLRTDLLDNRSLAMLLEISKGLIYQTLVSGQPLTAPVGTTC